jgi:N utilization substance protein B
MNKPPVVNARSRARQRTLQALYQWQLNGQHLDEIHAIETQFLEEQDMQGVDKAYFKKLLFAISADYQALDATLATVIDRPLEQLTPIELAILRLGAYELLKTNVPFRVAINEAVELAKGFGADQSHRYVNGVLDKLIKAKQQA